MGLKTNNSPVDTWLSKMEAAIKNIASLAVVDNLAVNQLIEHQMTTTVTAKVACMKEPKWTTMVAKNISQVVSQVVETPG